MMISIVVFFLIVTLLVIRELISRKKPSDYATVRVEVADPQPKEQTMSQRDTYAFTINFKNLIRIALNDPRARQEIREAVDEGPMAHTEKLGAANLKENAEAKDSWYTVFAGTSREVAAGEQGFLLRNQDGTRISMRLRSQVRKDHAASTPVETLPEADGGAELLRQALMSKDPAAARAIIAMAAQQTTEAAVGAQPAAAAAASPPAEDMPPPQTDDNNLESLPVACPFDNGAECGEADTVTSAADDAPTVTAEAGDAEASAELPPPQL